ncbi:hypothetical protein pipiens_017803 [Culex pipiens pipiens]|uniref:Uncharacterized protein n=1 Tax=Culex pipiens pipiens TaxID=38569 RepID=A0ABD1CEZ2_CULPP
MMDVGTYILENGIQLFMLLGTGLWRKRLHRAARRDGCVRSIRKLRSNNRVIISRKRRNGSRFLSRATSPAVSNPENIRRFTWGDRFNGGSGEVHRPTVTIISSVAPSRMTVAKTVVADLAAEISSVEMEPLMVKKSTARPNDFVKMTLSEAAVANTSQQQPHKLVSGSAHKLPKALAIDKLTKVKRTEKVFKSSLAGQQSAERVRTMVGVGDLSWSNRDNFNYTAASEAKQVSSVLKRNMTTHKTTKVLRISSIGTSRDFSDDGMAEKTMRVKVMIGSRRGVAAVSKQEQDSKDLS